MPGWGVLLFGLLFGWMMVMGGWAVYANVLFFVVLATAKASKPAIWPIILMLLLAATFPLFSEVPGDNGSAPVMAWGWGAAVWLTALLLAAAAPAVQQRWLTIRQVGLGLAGFWCLAIALHAYQWIKSSAFEREMYLSGGKAFAVAPLCGIPLAWPEDALVAPDQVPVLDIAPALNPPGRSPIRHLKLERYQSGEFAWLTYGDGDSRHNDPIVLKVRQPAQPRDFTLQVRSTEDGAVIRLLKNATGEILYEQYLREISPESRFASSDYCPLAREGWITKYQHAMLRALGQSAKPMVPASYPELKPEIAREPCDLGPQGIDGIKELQAWDGRQVILEPGRLRTQRGFCSESYIALASVGAPSDAPDALQGEMAVFDRQTLQPLAKFSNRKSCGSSCAKISGDILTGVRIDNFSATVETAQGEAQAERIMR